MPTAMNLSATMTINASSALTSLKSVDSAMNGLISRWKGLQAALGGNIGSGFGQISTEVNKAGTSIDQLKTKVSSLSGVFAQAGTAAKSAFTSIGTPIQGTIGQMTQLDTSLKTTTASMRQVDSSAALMTTSLGNVNRSALGNIQSQNTFRASLNQTNTSMKTVNASQEEMAAGGVKLQDRIGGIVSRIGGAVFSVTGLTQAYSEATAMSGLLEQSQLRVQEATQALSNAIIENGANSSEAVRAQQELTDAQRALSFQNRVTMLSWQDMIPFAVLLGITASKLASQHLPALLSRQKEVVAANSAVANSIKATDLVAKGQIVTTAGQVGALSSYTTASRTATVATEGLKFSIRSLLVATGVGAALVAASIAFDAWQRSSAAAAESTANFSTVTKEATNQVNPLKEALDKTTESVMAQTNQVDLLTAAWAKNKNAVITPGIGANPATVADNPIDFLRQRAMNMKGQNTDMDTQKRLYQMINEAGGNTLNTMDAKGIRDTLEAKLRGKYQDAEVDYLKSQVLQYGTALKNPITPSNAPGSAAIGVNKTPGSTKPITPTYSEEELKVITEAQKQYNAALGAMGQLLPKINTEKGMLAQNTGLLGNMYKQLNPEIAETTQKWNGMTPVMFGSKQVMIDTKHLMDQFPGTTQEMSKTMTDYVATIGKNTAASQAQAAQEKQHQQIRAATNQSLVDTANKLHLNEDAIKANTASYNADTGAIQTSNAALGQKNAALLKLVQEQGKYQNAVYNSSIAEGALQQGVVGAVEAFNNLLTSSIQNQQQTITYDQLLKEHAQRLGVELPAGIENTTKNMELLVTAAKGNTAAFKELQKQLEESITKMQELGGKATDAMLKGMKENGKKFTKEMRASLEMWLKDSTIDELEAHAKLKFNEQEATNSLAASLNTIISYMSEYDLDPATPKIELSPEVGNLMQTEVQAILDKIPKLVESGDLGKKAGANLTTQFQRALDLMKAGDYTGAMKQLNDTLTAPGGIGSMDSNQISSAAKTSLTAGINGAKPSMVQAATKAGKEVSEAFYKGWEGGGTIGNERTGELGSLDKKGMKFPAPDFTDFQNAVTTNNTTTKTSITQNATLAMTDFNTEMATGANNMVTSMQPGFDQMAELFNPGLPTVATDTFNALNEITGTGLGNIVLTFVEGFLQIYELFDPGMVTVVAKTWETVGASTIEGMAAMVLTFVEGFLQIYELFDPGLVTVNLKTWEVINAALVEAFAAYILTLTEGFIMIYELFDPGLVTVNLKTWEQVNAATVEGVAAMVLTLTEGFIMIYELFDPGLVTVATKTIAMVNEEFTKGMDTILQTMADGFTKIYELFDPGMIEVATQTMEKVTSEFEKGAEDWLDQIVDFLKNFESNIDTMSEMVANEVDEVNQELAKIERDIQVKVHVSTSGGKANQFGGSYQTDPFSPQLMLIGEGARREEVNIRPAGTSKFQDKRYNEVDKGTANIASGNRASQGGQTTVIQDTIIINNSDGTQTRQNRRRVFGKLGSH